MSNDSDFLEGCSPQSIIEARAAERLIARLHDANWSDDKQAELDAWLGASIAHEVAYLRLEAGWEGSDRLIALRQQPSTFKRPLSLSPSPKKLHFVAALLLCLLVGTGVYVTGRPHPGQVFATPIGGRETITLPDGSLIELNTNTELRLAPGSRLATLVRGEAYFQIKHDPSRSFVLTVGDHRVVDLGTKFVVRQKRDKVEVSLFEGRARVENDASGAQKRLAILAPGDVAIATQNELTVTRRPPSALAETISWRAGMVVFHHSTLGEAVEEFNRYNATQIRIADKSVENRVFAGKFRTGDAARFANVVGAALGLRVNLQANEIVISAR